jgi:hypothetical protein
MKRKILSFLICTLLIAITVLPVAAAKENSTPIFPRNKSILIADGIINLREDENGGFFFIEVESGFQLGFIEGKYGFRRYDGQNISIYENNILFSVVIFSSYTIMILQT